MSAAAEPHIIILSRVEPKVKQRSWARHAIILVDATALGGLIPGAGHRGALAARTRRELEPAKGAY